MQTATEQQSFCGREFTTEDMSLIQEVVETCAGLSRLELAHTVCELLEWKRPGGGLKARECRDFLERLESQGVLTLPDKKSCGSSNPRKLLLPAERGQVHSQLTGSVEHFAPLQVELVENRPQRQLLLKCLQPVRKGPYRHHHRRDAWRANWVLIFIGFHLPEPQVWSQLKMSGTLPEKKKPLKEK